MEVKGSALRPLKEFVKKKHPDRFEEWFNSLSKDSQRIMENPMVGAWYPMEEAITEPTKAVVDIIYDGDMQVAYDLGVFSAEFALTGV